MNEDGKFETSISKLKSFKEYINSDTFEKNITGGVDVLNKAMYELNRIESRIKSLKNKYKG